MVKLVWYNDLGAHFSTSCTWWGLKVPAKIVSDFFIFSYIYALKLKTGPAGLVGTTSLPTASTCMIELKSKPLFT